MPYVDLAIPPGIKGSFTKRSKQGYWASGSLFRWFPDMQAVGGWVALSTGAVSGTARACLSWRDNNNSVWVAIGTHTGLYVMSQSGAIYNITPVGFTAGRADALVGGGYGAGLYGVGTYGSPRDGQAITPASVWTFGLWNDRLVACMEGDGKIYEWELDTSNPAEQLTNSPTDCTAIVVTENQILVALKGRSAIWSDQGNNTDWTPTDLNQAGDQDVSSSGLWMCARQVRGRTLLFSTSDLWEAIYDGPPVVYSFQKAGDQCGPVSKGAPVVFDNTYCMWMGQDGFFVYNGTVQRLPCDVEDVVFSDINRTQISKVSAWNNAAFGEIWVHYPSAGSDENDRYVYYSYKQNYWATGTLARTCGDPGNALGGYPILLGTDGYAYQHETGEDYGDQTPYAHSGPIEWPDAGWTRAMLRQFVPDQRTLGDTQLTLYGQEFPNLPQTTLGTYATTGNPIDFFHTTRSLEIRVEFLSASARWGIPRLDAQPVSRR